MRAQVGERMSAYGIRAAGRCVGGLDYVETAVPLTEKKNVRPHFAPHTRLSRRMSFSP